MHRQERCPPSSVSFRSGKLLWIEAARGLCMLTVVWVHANYYLTERIADWWPGGYWAPMLYGFAVPTFYMISGFVLSFRDDLETPLNLRAFWRAKLTRILIPFWVWTAIMFLVYWKVAPDPLDTPRGILFAVGGFWQLHYIFSLVQFFLLYTLLRPRLRNGGDTRILVAAAVVSALVFGGSSIHLWLEGQDDGFIEMVLVRVSLTWSVFFFFGVWMGRGPERLERLARWAPLWLILALALYAAWGLEMYHWESISGEIPARMQILGTGLPCVFFAALWLLTLCYRLDRSRLGRALLRPFILLGADSMGIYMSHTTFLMLAAYGVLELGLTQTAWGSVAAMGGIAFLASWAFVRLLTLRSLRWPALVLFGRLSRTPS
jgi:peptidoglycan/LPS O-acetylase OafA/YrhL